MVVGELTVLLQCRAATKDVFILRRPEVWGRILGHIKFQTEDRLFSSSVVAALGAVQDGAPFKFESLREGRPY
jgi:hypothetical protein